ncbi:UNVERIFIED_CONTAM: hypothetical protein Sradi_1598500 [Sesamum radiatum]|uniref:Uncharacterized protein n=1 Tax=Sesamum radiatum TaxID=300843 RepID=A0AAW2U9Y8_SESRA
MVDAILRKTNQYQKSSQNKAPYKPPRKNSPYRPTFKPSFKNIDENSQPRRFLTEAEVKARKEKNICYKCDEPYTPGHKYKVRHVYMLMSEEEAKKYEEEAENLEGPTEEEDATVSFHTMGGSISNSTLRVNGRVNGKDIHILIDSGSTDCFIDEKVVQVLLRMVAIRS